MCQCSKEELNNLEIYYIDLYQTFNSKFGLNLESGGSKNKTCSSETRLKLGKVNKGRKMSKESTLKKKEWWINLTEEQRLDHKRKIRENKKSSGSEKKKGRPTWNKGLKGIYTKETLVKMSEIKKGMVNKKRCRPIKSTDIKGNVIYYESISDAARKNNIHDGKIERRLYNEVIDKNIKWEYVSKK